MEINKIKIAICMVVVTILVLSATPCVIVTHDVSKNYEKRQYDGPKIVFDDKSYFNNNIDNPNNRGEKGKPPQPPAVDRWAVVIGIADYPGWSSDLNYPDDDAIDMYYYLISKGYPSSNIKLLIDNQARSGNIIKAIDWMNSQEKLETSECVFFYSGHGTTYDGYNDGDSEYTDEGIVAADFKIILDGQLRAKFSTFTSKKIAFVFDSCFSGGMNDLIGAWTSVTYTGRVIAAACGEDELSYDGESDLQNGVFTYYFMQELNSHNIIEDAFNDAAPLATQYVLDHYEDTMTPFLYDTYTGTWQF